MGRPKYKTYKEIENDRKNEKHQYVTYDFNKIDDSYPNEFDLEKDYCHFLVPAKKGKISRMELINENIDAHNYYSGVEEETFHDVEKYLIQAYRNRNPKVQNIASLCDFFKRVTTVNVKGDLRVKCMLLSGGRINFKNLLNDLQATNGDPAQISDILNNLTGQVNAAAINGFYSNLAIVANESGRDAESLDDKNFDKVLLNKLLKGYKGINEMVIPSDPSLAFSFPGVILQNTEKLNSQHNVEDKKLHKFVEDILTYQNKMKTIYLNQSNEKTK